MNDELDYKFNKYDLNFLIKLKKREFKKQDVHNISEKQIKDYLFEVKWKKRTSLPMCELIDDVMSLQLSDLFDYLSVKAVKEASHLSINAFNEFIAK